MELGHLLTRSGLTHPEVCRYIQCDNINTSGKTVYFVGWVTWNRPVYHWFRQNHVANTATSWTGRSAKLNVIAVLFIIWRDTPPHWARVSSFTKFLDHTQRRITVGRTPLDEWSDRRRELYLTAHNTHNREASMPPVLFEPTISADERPQTYALDRAATGTDSYRYTSSPT
jgi:hypothetical protein